MTLRGLAALGVLVVSGCKTPAVQSESLPQLDYPNVTTSTYGEGWDPCASFRDYCVCQWDNYAVISDRCKVSQGGKALIRGVYFCPADNAGMIVFSNCLALANYGADLLDAPINGHTSTE